MIIYSIRDTAHGNQYKDLINERINNEDAEIELAFTDVGRLLTYNELEYEKLVTSLNTQPLSTERLDWW